MSGNLQWFFSPEANNSVAEVMRYPAAILTKNNESFLAALRTAGYTGQVLQYVRGEAVQIKHSPLSPLNNQVAWDVGDYDELDTDHPDWFLYKTGGVARATSLASPADYEMMDPANTDWQAYFINKINTYQAGAGAQFDGVFLDNIEGSLAKRQQQGQTLALYTTDSAYQAAIKSFITAVKAGVTKNFVSGNIINTRSNAAWNDYLSVMDGGFNEFSFVDGHTGWIGTSKWLRHIQMALAGKKVIYVAQSDLQNATARQRFCFASYLLVYSANTFFRFTSAANYDESWWYPNYDTVLGNPKGAYTHSGDDYQRLFDNGVVKVNPTKHTSSITVNAPPPPPVDPPPPGHNPPPRARKVPTTWKERVIHSSKR